jgi:hypothetical protein
VHSQAAIIAPLKSPVWTSLSPKTIIEAHGDDTKADSELGLRGSEYQERINRKMKNILSKDISWSRFWTGISPVRVKSVALTRTRLRCGVAGGETYS